MDSSKVNGVNNELSRVTREINKQVVRKGLFIKQIGHSSFTACILTFLYKSCVFLSTELV